MTNNTATMTRATVGTSKYQIRVEDEGTVDERFTISVFQGKHHHTRIEVTTAALPIKWAVYANAEEDDQTPDVMRAFAVLVIEACDLADKLNARTIA